MDNSIISTIVHPPFANYLFIIKIVIVGLTVLLAGFIIYFLSKTNWLKFRFIQDLVEIFTYKPFAAKKLTKQWIKIKQRLESGMESEFKLAIIEADAMLDDILKKLGYSGETLSERLKLVKTDILPNLEEVLEAHKIRNNIVHDPDYKLSLAEAEKTISCYEKALTDLEVL